MAKSAELGLCCCVASAGTQSLKLLLLGAVAAGLVALMGAVAAASAEAMSKRQAAIYAKRALRAKRLEWDQFPRRIRPKATGCRRIGQRKARCRVTHRVSYTEGRFIGFKSCRRWIRLSEDRRNFYWRYTRARCSRRRAGSLMSRGRAEAYALRVAQASYEEKPSPRGPIAVRCDRLRDWRNHYSLHRCNYGFNVVDPSFDPPALRRCNEQTSLWIEYSSPREALGNGGPALGAWQVYRSEDPLCPEGHVFRSSGPTSSLVDDTWP